MQKATTILLIFCTSLLFGQQSFNYKRDFPNILKKAQDKNSAFYYETLLQRFNTCDTTLTSDEIIALQIGQTHQQAYCPYADIETERAIYSLNSSKYYKACIELCNSFQKRNPLSLMLNLEKSFAFHKLDEKDSAAIYFWKYTKLIEADLTTGDGIDNPIFVLGPIDGQIIIERYWQKEIGIMSSGEDSDGNFLDLLEMKNEKTNKSVTLKFNIQHATERMFDCH